jgi:hypothetical protein
VPAKQRTTSVDVQEPCLTQAHTYTASGPRVFGQMHGMQPYITAYAKTGAGCCYFQSYARAPSVAAMMSMEWAVVTRCGFFFDDIKTADAACVAGAARLAEIKRLENVRN